ncbi:MSMEG_3727 family PQQ-associated protein [Amycolatopsis rhabdoformis]|uniref:MSMEG_3727 family PQQ-associated protein n=1 Tax=Amycolatopsis rhabdoformis TaxID=1448059 RepID=A0ABZ1IJY4_9PSEU|nr:MSMEG_3727 family PQQ-associated protein [Amycolatopsis rhabdoformis]WSE34543.1 MSMEG_3727 family PQQ-associated protein [Amycolatopsis rhabdoformis]
MTIAQERDDLLSELSGQNKATIGAVLGSGTIAKATERADGTMEATITIHEDAMTWDPGVLIMPHSGVLELTIINDDKNTHACLLPSNGDRQFIGLLNHSKGTATLELDGPGCYWYGSPAGNDEGRGLMAAIVVTGEVPPEAKLDRPAQPRP